MSDETQGTASQPAEGDEPVNLDAEAQPGATEQQEKPEGEQPAEEAGEKPEGEEKEEKERKRLSGAEKAKRRQTFLLNQLAEKDRELEELRQASRKTEGQSDADKAPKEEEFNGDWQAFQDAKAAHAARQAVREEFRREATSKQSATQAAELRERVDEHEDRCDEARETITDFDKVLESTKGITIREDLAREVLFSDKSALLQYHLAQNHNELHRLNGLNGRELAREIGRLEAKLEMPAAKKQTTAPAPLKTLKGGAAPAFDPNKSDNMDDFAKWLHADMQKRQGRR